MNLIFANLMQPPLKQNNRLTHFSIYDGIKTCILLLATFWILPKQHATKPICYNAASIDQGWSNAKTTEAGIETSISLQLSRCAVHHSPTMPQTSVLWRSKITSIRIQIYIWLWFITWCHLILMIFIFIWFEKPSTTTSSSPQCV